MAAGLPHSSIPARNSPCCRRRPPRSARPDRLRYWHATAHYTGRTARRRRSWMRTFIALRNWGRDQANPQSRNRRDRSQAGRCSPCAGCRFPEIGDECGCRTDHSRFSCRGASEALLLEVGRKPQCRSSRKFAAFVANLKFEDLPPEVVDRAKGVTLQALSSALIARDMPGSRQALALMQEEEAGGGGAATVLCHGT